MKPAAPRSGGASEAGLRSPAADAAGVPAWELVPAGRVRPGGLPAVVTDPAGLETPILRRILGILREEYDPEFAVRWLGPVPFTPLEKPVAEARVALVTTAGLHARGDEPFDTEGNRWGDTGFRWIPHRSPAEALDLDADSVDPKYVRQDPEAALPRRALDRMVAAGAAGSAAPRHPGFCEGVLRPLPGLAESARRAAAGLGEDEVDAALLFPTCSLCVLNVCVIARELEAAGISTATVTVLPELTRLVGAPRLLSLRFPLGAPCGDPGNHALHDAVVRAALQRLASPEPPGATVDSPLEWRR